MLRALRLALTAAALAAPAGPALAEDRGEQTPEEIIEFAPGSTGEVTAPLATIMDEAERRGEALRGNLHPLDAPDDAFSGVDFEALRKRALSNPRARALLGVDGAGETAGGGDTGRYDGATVFLLASFSMPQPSLRQMMEEARAFGLPVVFRGFVNNSVPDTQAALEETFGSLETAVGFSIDPTVFARFNVTSVPQVIAMAEAVDVCETPGCEGDPVPPHDRVKGNVPVAFALRLIAERGEVAAAEAARLLAEAGDAR